MVKVVVTLELLWKHSLGIGMDHQHYYFVTMVCGFETTDVF